MSDLITALNASPANPKVAAKTDLSRFAKVGDLQSDGEFQIDIFKTADNFCGDKACVTFEDLNATDWGPFTPEVCP